MGGSLRNGSLIIWDKSKSLNFQPKVWETGRCEHPQAMGAVSARQNFFFIFLNETGT